MHPVSQAPTAPDISRYALKQATHWIRDDLDMLIAREGPNVLRPDDVLALHELFVALRQATTITALDLRATGIHRAVKDVAGVATRWPGRLCDDCDDIISIWTSKFGKLDELHPFLYGRGGRLEGIASVSEYTREALLKRWSEHCPEKIHPKVSHRQGDLGFKAGDWWINPLFAFHAGIIGVESLEGGTTYDKNGAYAIVLKDTGEIDAQSAEFFTYRCPIDDKGKFRLTAATPKSREKIRVLRSHNINSIWGPKAGIRYEGTYLVKGWCIRQAKLKDTIGGEWKEGHIIYEVMLQRDDPTPMEEVSRRPTNMEVDDYADYKRLRKLHREHKRKAQGSGPLPMSAQTLNTAPHIPPSQFPVSSIIAPQSLLRLSPSVSRKTTFKELAFDAPHKVLQDSGGPPTAGVISPRTIPGTQESFFALEKTGTPALPALNEKNKYDQAILYDTALHDKYVGVSSTGASSRASSPRSGKSDLKEIIPWIELEADLSLPSSPKVPPVIREQTPGQVTDGLEARAARLNPVKSVRRLARHSKQPGDLGWGGNKTRKESTATDVLKQRRL